MTSLPLYTIYEKKEKQTLKSCLLKTKPDHMKVHAVQSKHNWEKEKINLILKAIDENWGGRFIYSDCGVIFYKDPTVELLHQIQDKDLAMISDEDGGVQLGFFIARANSQTRAFFTKLSTSGEEALQLFRANYCNIKRLTNKFFLMPTHKLEGKYGGEMRIRQPSFINNVLVLLDNDRDATHKRKAKTLNHISSYKAAQERKIIAQGSVESINKIALQTSALAQQAEELISALKLHAQLLRIKSDQATLNMTGEVTLKAFDEPQVVIAVNHPKHLNAKRFQLAEQSRARLEKDSNGLIKFKNIIPARNASTALGVDSDKPFLKDLLAELVRDGNPDWIGYLNADTVIKKEWLSATLSLFTKQYDSIAYMADGAEYEDEKLDEFTNKAATLTSRGGRDMFLIKSELWNRIVNLVPDYFIGEHQWDIGLYFLLEKHGITFDAFAPVLIRQEFHVPNWNGASKLARHNEKASEKAGLNIGETFTVLERRPLMS